MAGSRHTFIGLGKERRGQNGGGQAAAGNGLMTFNGETISRLDTALRGGEPEGRGQETKLRHGGMA
jgi:hypothetical protein